MAYQIVIVQGNVGRDPEVRYSQAGKAVCKFSVAVSDKGGGKEHTEWFNAVAFDKTAEVAAQYVKKGDSILLEGRLKTEDYEKDGVQKRYTSFLVSRLTLLGNKRSGDAAPAKAAPAKATDDGFDSDIPF